MKKILYKVAVAIVAVVSVAMASCANAEEGESWDDWKIRNTINGFGWHVDMLKDANGNWVRWENSLTLYFEVKFSASNHNFSSRKFYYKDGVSDETTKEEYSSSNTAYTIKDAKIIEGTVNGEPYFRITLNKKPDSSMEGILYFYRENKTYEVIMTR
jgi:hypothetical protein